MWFWHKKEKDQHSLCFISFFQALGLLVYCGLVALLIWNGNKWFGTVPNYIGPLLFLTLFTTSALVSALIVLGYPFLLLWEKKKTKDAIKLVGYTAAWSVFFVLLIILLILFFRF